MLQAITRAAHGDKNASKIESTSPSDFMPLVYRPGSEGEGEKRAGDRGASRRSRSRARDSAPTTRSQFEMFKAEVRAMGEGMKRGTVQ